MDPEENLKEQLRISERIQKGEQTTGDAMRLAELVEALDEWIRKGGFLPSPWKKDAQENTSSEENQVEELKGRISDLAYGGGRK